ncbi:MAG: DedA family protein [candidate division Zixibacteria bacterium]|nr:DedA family protein [candidate division Zixibacteria bacterium]
MEGFFNSRGAELLNFISSHGVLWIYFFLFFSSIIETFFPPYPGDIVTFMGGYLASSGVLSLPLAFLFPCAGSLCGALALYYLGMKKGRKLFEKDKGKIFNKTQLNKIENWFRKYGGKVILVSRFITGVRSGIALTAGLGKIELWKMTVYSLISIFAWNGIIMSLGTLTQQNWQRLYKFLSLYNRLIFITVVLIFIFWLIWWLKNRSGKNISGTGI